MLTLRVEASPGSDVDDVAKGMVNLAKALKVRVECRFNGVELFAYSVTKWASMVKNYEDEFSSLQHAKNAGGL